MTHILNTYPQQLMVHSIIIVWELYYLILIFKVLMVSHRLTGVSSLAVVWTTVFALTSVTHSGVTVTTCLLWARTSSARDVKLINHKSAVYANDVTSMKKVLNCYLLKRYSLAMFLSHTVGRLTNGRWPVDVGSQVFFYVLQSNLNIFFVTFKQLNYCTHSWWGS